MRFPRASRLTRERDLEAVRLQGKRVRTAQIEVRYLASPVQQARVGVIVPRYGKSAVDRNMVKRRLKDLARTELLPALGKIDVVIRATPASYAASFDQLRAALRKAMQQLPRPETQDPQQAPPQAAPRPEVDEG